MASVGGQAMRQLRVIAASTSEQSLIAHFGLGDALVNWTKLAARTSGGTTFQFTDTQATNNGARFYRMVVP